MGQRAVVAERREAVDGAHADDVEPARALEQIDEHVERRGLARAPERPRGLGLDQVAVVAQRGRLDELHGLRRAKVPERFDDGAPHLGMGRAPRALQGLEGRPTSNASQRRRALRPHPPERAVVGEHARERRDRRRVVDAREGLGREPAAARGRRPGELGAQHVAGSLDPHLADDAHVGVDDDERRPRRGGERERLLPLGHVEPAASDATRRVRDVEIERRRSKLAGTPSVVGCTCLAATVRIPFSHVSSTSISGCPGL